MKLFDFVRQSATGSAILDDWIGEGGVPVDRGRAECRALICSKCTMNVSGNWLGRLKSEVADLIKGYLEVKNGVELKVSVEDKIGFCEACGCVNSLKVWTPIDHIMKKTKAQDLAKLPGNCWVITERTP